VESDSAAKTALNVIAETKAFLDVNVVVTCPNGEEVITIARLDTAANTDVVAPKLANVLKSNKVQWSAKGGAFVEVCGASSVRPTGFLSVATASRVESDSAAKTALNVIAGTRHVDRPAITVGLRLISSRRFGGQHTCEDGSRQQLG
jgi:hypothetical protein